MKHESADDILEEMMGNEFDEPHLNREGIIGARRLARDWSRRLKIAIAAERAQTQEKNKALEETLQTIAAMEYPHNFQRERRDIVDSCYDLSRAIRICRTTLESLSVARGMNNDVSN